MLLNIFKNEYIFIYFIIYIYIERERVGVKRRKLVTILSSSGKIPLSHKTTNIEKVFNSYVEPV